jgi:hypothetical protein
MSGKTGFISKGIGTKKGKIEISLGSYTEVDLPVEDLQKGIFSLKFAEPSVMLFQLLQYMDGKAERIASLSESMMGNMPPSDTTSTSMLAIMEQGLKVFSTIHKRIHRSLGEELRKIFYLNSLYLDEKVYALVQDSTSGEYRSLQSGRMDFMNNIDVLPASDPSITSRAEKLAKAQQVYQAMSVNPMIQQNPIGLYQITKDFLEAMEVQDIGRFKLDEMLQFGLQVFQMKSQAVLNGGVPNQPGGPQGVGQPAGNPGPPPGPPGP